MKFWLATLLLLLLTILNPSCGLLGVYRDNINTDPDYQTEKLNKITRRPIAMEWDSLVKQIDSASSTIPSDLGETTLIIETYKYEEFLKLFDNKYTISEDTEKMKRHFKQYERSKFSLVKAPKYKIVYLDKGEYDSLDLSEYKYVLKTTNRIEGDTNTVLVYDDGFVCCYVSTLIYYVFNRENKEVFKSITDASLLSNNK